MRVGRGARGMRNGRRLPRYRPPRPREPTAAITAAATTTTSTAATNPPRTALSTDDDDGHHPGPRQRAHRPPPQLMVCGRVRAGLFAYAPGRPGGDGWLIESTFLSFAPGMNTPCLWSF